MDERRIAKKLVLLDIGESAWLGQALIGFDENSRIPGIGGVDARDGCCSYGLALFAGMVENQLVSGFHLAQMLQGDGICDAVPDGFAVTLEIGEGIGVRLGFQQIRHRGR